MPVLVRCTAILRFSVPFLLTVSLAWAIPPPAAHAMRIVGVSMSRGVGGDGTVPVNIVDTFPPDAPEIHLVVVIEGAKAKTPIKASWISVDAIETPDYEIASLETRISADGDARAHFKLTCPKKGWPVGNYRVDVYATGKYLTSVPFSVRPSGPAPPASRAKAGKTGLGSPPPSPGSALLGHWVQGERDHATSLIFESRDRLVYDGEAYRYTLRPGEIVVLQEEGEVVYPYVLKGSSLEIVFPDGKRRFRRADAARPAGAAQPAVADISDAVSFFRGSYFHDIRSSGVTKLYLYADGTFVEHSDTAYGGRFTDPGGNQTGAWGTTSANQNQGTWSVRGKRNAGVFLLKYRNGSIREVSYQVFIENGKPFWGEYKVNGIHMVKSPIQ